MAFDRQRTKHHLLHISISLSTVLLCMSYIQKETNLLALGKLRESLVLPIVLCGEILKSFLTRHYANRERDLIQKQRKKTAWPSFGNIAKAVLLQSICTMLFGFICIILGAPVLHSYEQTISLALLLTTMTVSPAVFLVGAGGSLQITFCEKTDLLTKVEELSLELIKYNAAGAIIGAWCGSVVSPLDWDREWQLYPIPNVIGALLGTGLVNIYFCSKLLLATGKVYYNRKRS